MFSVVVQMQVQPGKREEFLAAMGENAASAVRDEPGCHRFDVCSVDGDDHAGALRALHRRGGLRPAPAPHFLRWRGLAAEVLVPGSQVTTTGTLLVSNVAEQPA